MIQDLFNQFPNQHPLFVHFPIALLLAAVLGQLAVLIFPENKNLRWLTFLLLISGWLGALIAVQTAVHISGGADEKAIEIFEAHRLLGLTTFWLSLAATIIRFLTINWFRKKWVEIMLAILIATTGIFVITTGHRGAQLVYIYNVGPQGNNVMSK